MDVSRRRFFSVVAGAGAGVVGGVSSARAHVALPHSEHPAPPQEFPQEGFELTKLQWFNPARGFGYGTGLSSGHQIRIDKKVLEEADIEKKVLTTKYWVYWKRDGDRVVAEKISGSVPLTREELLKAANWQEWTAF